MTKKTYKLDVLYGHKYLPPPRPPERVYQRIRVMGKSYIVPTNRWRMGAVEFWMDSA